MRASGRSRSGMPTSSSTCTTLPTPPRDHSVTRSSGRTTCSAVRERGGGIAVRDPLRRAREAAPGHALEGCLHEQLARARLSHPLHRRHQLHITLLAASAIRGSSSARVTARPSSWGPRPRQLAGGGRDGASSRSQLHRSVRAGAPRPTVGLRRAHESWQLSLSLRRADGHGAGRSESLFQVFLPSRFYVPRAPTSWDGDRTSATRSRQAARGAQGTSATSRPRRGPSRGDVDDPARCSTAV